ncbi:MAG TPA: thiolase family protein [Coxiellaceae bacterium]|nr:thiolase family protein [Coxiellaceae bacterium]
MTTQDPIVILSARRTPMGNFNGIFKDTPAPTLGAVAIAAALKTANISAEKIDAVYMGCVLSAGLGQAPARQAALAAGLPQTVPCVTVNKMCGSGLQTVLLAMRELSLNKADIVIAGGMENMTRAGQTHMMYDGLTNAYDDHLSMGALAENCAEKFNFTREAQDAYAIQSIKRAMQTSEKGLFQAEIAPVLTEVDEGFQKVNFDKIPNLKPAFKPNGTITAANASNISDGAAALVLTRLSFAEKNHLKPLAKIIDDCVVAQAPEWFSTAPIAAIEKLLQKLHWSVNDVDLFEINEAFAVVPLAAMQALNIPLEKVNVHGGACVLGHPIGASGARILTTLIYALKARQQKRGVAAICIGGGEAIAIAIEII